MSQLEKSLTSLAINLNSNMQSIAKLENCMSQMAKQLTESEKGKFPSQHVVNPNISQSDPLSSAQLNAIHTLRSGREVDNRVEMPTNNKFVPPSTHDHSSSPFDDEKKNSDEESERVNEPPAPFLNRLRAKKTSAHMENITEIFKQVKINVPLLDAIH